jgi:hypothetical protein
VAQLFHPSTNTFSKFTIFGAVFVIAATFFLARAFNRSPYVIRNLTARAQPVPFSHRHHVGGLGVDCRYCHTSVEESAFAGIPPTKTCMNCHSQIWTNSPMLEPVRSSFRTGDPIRWNRVHNLAGFVYFNHSIHVKKGVGCATCHGKVDEMPLTWQASSLQMEWCLNCHRNPENYIRPKEYLFSMKTNEEIVQELKTDQLTMGTKLLTEYRVNKKTSCSICHR